MDFRSINVNIIIWKIRVFSARTHVFITNDRNLGNHNNSGNKNVNKTWTNNVHNNHSYHSFT